MKKIIILFVVGLLTQQIIHAQGTLTYLSNIGQPSTGSNPVGSNSWLAAGFFTGTNGSGYLLNSVQLAITDATGNPSGFTVMLYGQANNPFGVSPGSSLGTLNGSTDPASSGIYTYTPASDITLSPGKDYFIVLTSGTSVANGAYEWSYVNTSSYNPVGGWITRSPYFYSANGSSWGASLGSYPQFAINATAVPEPSSSWLVLLGSGILVYVRRTLHR